MNTEIKTLADVDADKLVRWLVVEVDEAVAAHGDPHYRDELFDVLGLACHLLARHSEDVIRATIVWWAATHPRAASLNELTVNMDALDNALICYEFMGPEVMVKRAAEPEEEKIHLRSARSDLAKCAARLVAACDVDQHLTGLVRVIAAALAEVMSFGDKAARESLAVWCAKQQSRQRDVLLLDDAARLNGVLRSC